MRMFVHKLDLLLNQLQQCGLRTPQCTVQGSLDKPQDRMVLKVKSFSMNSSLLNLFYVSIASF